MESLTSIAILLGLFINSFNCFTKSGLDLEIYPIPVNDILRFGINTGKVEITIFDISGRPVLKMQTYDNQIDISNLQKGVYMIKIVDKSEILIRKFVKQ
jgi:hypothetical protein